MKNENSKHFIRTADYFLNSLEKSHSTKELLNQSGGIKYLLILDILKLTTSLNYIYKVTIFKCQESLYHYE